MNSFLVFLCLSSYLWKMGTTVWGFPEKVLQAHPRYVRSVSSLPLPLLIGFILNPRVEDPQFPMTPHIIESKYLSLLFSFWSHLRCHGFRFLCCGCSLLRASLSVSLIQLIFSFNATEFSNKTFTITHLGLGDL